jgi:tRNA dimethylallyltransferase
LNSHHTAWLLAGATATGKTAAAQLLAERLSCAVLSADAMLVYRGMDIGTAKPSPAARGCVPYFGIDLVTPAEPFSTGLWLADAARALEAAALAPTPGRSLEGERPREPSLIVVGGTGLYLKALTDGLDGDAADPEARARWQTLYDREGLPALQRALAGRDPAAFAALADPANPRRLIRALEHLDARGSLPGQWRRDAPRASVAVLRLPREQLHARISRRVAAMFREGLLDEARALRHACPSWSPTAAQAIGYAEALAVLDGALTPAAAAERIAARTRQLAKRQETWFRHQTQAVWIDIDDNDPPARVAERVLETWRQHGPTPLVSP